jgi:tRNA threonylcarbamoyladenosine biosynthesis protein TsaB
MAAATGATSWWTERVLILGLDTATRATTTALLNLEAGTVIERRDDPARGERPRHTTRLLALAVEAMLEAGCGWEDLTRIAVGVGPGTFTGLRIGVSTARALAAARDLPLVGVSTLQSLAHGAAAAAASEGRAVLAVLDARRAELFAAAWSPGTVADPAAPPLLAPCALSPEALAEALPGSTTGWLAVGEGAVEFRAVLERSGDGRVLIPDNGSELHRVSAIDHCRLAIGLPSQNHGDVRPAYLRLPDAELTLRARANSDP